MKFDISPYKYDETIVNYYMAVSDKTSYDFLE